MDMRWVRRYMLTTTLWTSSCFTRARSLASKCATKGHALSSDQARVTIYQNITVGVKFAKPESASGSMNSPRPLGSLINPPSLTVRNDLTKLGRAGTGANRWTRSPAAALRQSYTQCPSLDNRSGYPPPLWCLGVSWSASQEPWGSNIVLTEIRRGGMGRTHSRGVQRTGCVPLWIAVRSSLVNKNFR